MVFRKILKNIFMGPKLLEINTYSVQANNSHVMVLPEFIVNYIVKYHLGTMSPNIQANMTSHIHMGYYIGNTFIQYIRINMGWTGYMKIM